MAERVFMHVGTPKSGTTYLQAVLWQNASLLKESGLLLPGRFKTHYAAAKGITRRENRKQHVGIDINEAWPKLVRQMDTFDGDAAVSHELMAPASRAQAESAKALLRDSDVHVVITARALHKQLPAAWQEQVKAGLAAPYDVFVGRVRSREAQGEWFWRVQDVVDIADRWGSDLPASNVHIVVVPADSTDSHALWRRFATALRLDPAAYDADVPRKNMSLGPVESEVLRRVHALEDARFTDRERHQWTRRLLASEILGQRRGPALRLPDGAQPWVMEQAALELDALRATDYDIVGDLADLQWQEPPADARAVESVTAAEVDEAVRWAIARLQEELVSRQPTAPLPSVGPDDGAAGILELLEHIRAADLGLTPRVPQPRSAQSRLLKKSITALRGR